MRLDWMIATDMAKSGRFSSEGIAKAIEQYSPEVAAARSQQQAQRGRGKDDPDMSR